MAFDTDQFKESIIHYRDHPVDFCEDIVRIELDDWQKQAIRWVSDGYNVAIKAAHGPGKTTLAANTILWYLATHPYCRIPCTAPTFNQLQDALWPEISHWMKRSPLEELFEQLNARLRVHGYEDRWFAVARSSNKPDNMQGFHSEYGLLYVVDEASGVPEDVMQAVLGALTGDNSQLLMIGNPNYRSGFFWETFREQPDNYKTMSISYRDSDRIEQEYVDQIRNRYGADSDVFRIRCLGKFPTQDEDALISWELAKRATEQELHPDPDDVQLGIDVARKGKDETVIITRQGPVVTNMETYNRKSTAVTTGYVVRTIDRLLDEDEISSLRVCIDDTGVGGGVTDALEETIRQEDWEGVDLIPVNFGENPWDEEQKDMYLNAAAMMWDRVRVLMEREEMQIPDDDDLIGQLSERRWEPTSKGKIRLEKKADMKSRGMRSPDRADALCLAYYNKPCDNRTIQHVAPVVDDLTRINPVRTG